MTVQQRFPDVRWVWKGGISFVYEVHPRIVVKVPKYGDFEREQFQRELKIYEILSCHSPCPSLVQCLYYTNDGIFLEYMRDASLCYRIQNNQTRDSQTGFIVTNVEKLEPLTLRKEWMNDLTQAVAFLESLNLAHGDLRPENILLDRDRLKLSDFDCTADIGTYFEACMAPYGRLLNSKEVDQGESGTSGSLGPRTEQFALGSIFYLINYGFEVYGDRCLTDDSKEHGPKLVDLLQDMEFPKLNGNPLIDDIIDKCWHNKYATIAELATETKKLVHGGTLKSGTNAQIPSIPGLQTGEANKPGGAEGGEQDSHNRGMNQDRSEEDFTSEDTFCKDFDTRGLLRMLSSGEPEQLGFSLGWYRHLQT